MLSLKNKNIRLSKRFEATSSIWYCDIVMHDENEYYQMCFSVYDMTENQKRICLLTNDAHACFKITGNEHDIIISNPSIFWRLVREVKDSNLNEIIGKYINWFDNRSFDGVWEEIKRHHMDPTDLEYIDKALESSSA